MERANRCSHKNDEGSIGDQDMTMPTYYEITIQGHLDQHWSTWFDGLSITHEPNGNTTLAGPIVDQTALHGVLIKVRDLGLSLIGVRRMTDGGLANTQMGCGQIEL
jgi:hypothetical protein